MKLSPGDWIVWRVEYLDHVSYSRAEIDSVGQRTVVVKATGTGSGVKSRVTPSAIVFAGTLEAATRLYLELAGSKRQYDGERKAARAAHIERCQAIIAAAKR